MQVQQFLGFCNYYRRFVKDYAKIAQPITELSQRDDKFYLLGLFIYKHFVIIHRKVLIHSNAKTLRRPVLLAIIDDL